MRDTLEAMRDQLIGGLFDMDRGHLLAVHDGITALIDTAVDLATANELATVEEVVETLEGLVKE